MEDSDNESVCDKPKVDEQLKTTVIIALIYMKCRLIEIGWITNKPPSNIDEAIAIGEVIIEAIIDIIKDGAVVKVEDLDLNDEDEEAFYQQVIIIILTHNYFHFLNFISILVTFLVILSVHRAKSLNQFIPNMGAGRCMYIVPRQHIQIVRFPF